MARGRQERQGNLAASTGTFQEGAPRVRGRKARVEELIVHGGIHGRAALFCSSRDTGKRGSML